MASRSEVLTQNELEKALVDQPYRISREKRCLDALRQFVDDGSTHIPGAGDHLLAGLRAHSGPLSAAHPWLEPGDWDYAFKSHFDFVVETAPTTRYPLRPVFAVEFDGPTHVTPDAMARDLRKNRLCAASGLPLLRVGDGEIAPRERMTFLRWITRQWALRHAEIPRLAIEREARLEELGADEIQACGEYLLCEHPDLDIDFVFALEHPFEPIATRADRVIRKRRLLWPSMPHSTTKPSGPHLWRVTGTRPPLPMLLSGPENIWEAAAFIEGSDNSEFEVTATGSARSWYPLTNGPVNEDPLDILVTGKFPYLMAGPWINASSRIAEALCWLRLIDAIDRELLIRSSR